MRSIEFIATLSGWIGMSALLTAYALRQRQSPLTNGLLNLLGAVGLAFSCYVANAVAASTLNIIWSMIAVRDISASIRHKRPTASPVPPTHVRGQ